MVDGGKNMCYNKISYFICACDGIGRHARFRFSCFQRVGSSPFRRTKTISSEPVSGRRWVRMIGFL